MNPPKRTVYRQSGLNTGKEIVISKCAYYFDGFTICSTYRIDFGQDQFDYVMETLKDHIGSNTTLGFEEMQACADSVGIPYRLHWMDAQKETILWGSRAIDSTEIFVTKETNEVYHVYVDECWDPFYSLIK